MPGVARPRLRAALTLALAVAAPVQPSRAQAAPTRASLVGTYDGGQMEVGAGLELRADGRFRYMLSYGALDEEAAGTWRVAGGAVLLTSDPVAPPRFVLLGRRAGPGDRLRVSLEVPAGLSRQYFTLAVRHADGSVAEQQFGEQADWLDVPPADRPVAVALALPVFDLRGAPVNVAAARGSTLSFRFEPHDLGKVAFAATPLTIDGGALLLARHGLTLRFRRARD